MQTTRKIISTALTVLSPPVPGETITFETPGSPMPTQAEVTEVIQRGQELWAIIKSANADGKWEFSEILVVVVKATEVAGLGIWGKIARFFRGLFGKK